MKSLDKKSKKILYAFLTHDVLTTERLKQEVDMSERTLHEYINHLNEVLSEYRSSIIKKPRVGMWLEADNESINTLHILAGGTGEEHLSDAESRVHYLIVRLLEYDDYLTIQSLAEEIHVSHGTMVNDLEKVERWLKGYHLRLERVRNKGVRVLASEKKRRQILATIYQLQKDNHTLLKMIRGVVDHEDFKGMEDYIGSAIFSQFDAFEIGRLKRIVKTMETSSPLQFSDEGFVALVIHIAIALKRARDGQYVKLDNKTKQRLKNNELYDKANAFVEAIESAFDIELPDDEACYILMHMLGAKVQAQNETDDQAFSPSIENVVEAMIARAESLLDTNLSQDDILKRSLALHIQASINRLEHNLPIHNPYLEDIKQGYPMVFEASIQSYDYLKQRFSFAYNDHEIAYIAMHIQASIERNKAAVDHDPKNVLLVCSSGVGTSQLLSSKFKRIFADLNLVATVPLSHVDKYPDVDLIVSTVPFEHESVPVVIVSPFLTHKDLSTIEKRLNQMSQTQSHRPFKGFTKLISRTLIRTNVRYSNMKRLIKAMCDEMVEQRYVNESFYQSVMDREAISSTAVLDVALPHGHYEHVQKDAISIWTLNQPIRWGDFDVFMVALIAIKKETTGDLQAFYDTLYDMISDETLKKNIKVIRDDDALYKLLSEGENNANNQ